MPKIRSLYLIWCLSTLLLTNPLHGQTGSNLHTSQERAQKLTAQAVNFFNAGQIEESEKNLLSSLQIAPNVYETHFWLGRIYAGKAASSPNAKERSLKHFRKALELQPYGEDGDVARGWLLRIGGRPKTIRFNVARHSSLKNLDSDLTEDTIKHVAASAQVTGLNIQESATRAIDLNEDKIKELSASCRNAQGELQTGWLVLVSLEDADRSYERKTGHSVKVRGKVWIFDPLTEQLLKPNDVSNAASTVLSRVLKLKNESSQQATEMATSEIADSIWNQCRVIVAANPDLKLLDETQFSTRLDGIYARSIASGDTGLSLPLIMLAPVKSIEAEDADAARQLGADLQFALLQEGKLAVVSPGNSSEALTEIQSNLETAGNAEWTRVGQMAGCHYILLSNLSRFGVKSSGFIIGSKIKGQVALELKLINAQTGQIVFSKNIEKKASNTKILSGSTKSLINIRAKIIEEVIKEADEKISEFVEGQPLPERLPLIRQMLAESSEPQVENRLIASTETSNGISNTSNEGTNFSSKQAATRSTYLPPKSQRLPQTTHLIPQPRQAEIESKLNFLVGLRNFSRTQPLSPERMMKWVICLAGEGNFPSSYKGLDLLDESISYSSAQQFTRSIIGRPLTMWKPLGLSSESTIKMEGNKLGWVYNSGNTMYSAPIVRLTKRADVRGKRVTAQFRISHRQGNLSNNPPYSLVATGTATLEPFGRSWVVTSWQIKRNNKWSYYKGEK